LNATPTAPSRVDETPLRFGLRANWHQFWLLVGINGFVGAMVGLERTVLPLIAEREFGLASKGAILSFIVTFGLTKAFANLGAGWLSERVGRKRVLIAGWLVGLPVPFLVMWAPTWSWVVFANVLLGINQGFAWSTTVVMKIDLVGSERRGFAMGLNEFAGYLAVAASAFATGVIATRYGLRPEPFYLGIAFASLGLALSVLFVRDTKRHAVAEGAMSSREHRLGSIGVFARTSWRSPALSSVSQAGLVNNLNDGLAWGLFPLYFATGGLALRDIGILTALYPATWGIVQLWTGALSDRWGRRGLIVYGMLVQGAALVAMALSHGFVSWAVAVSALGVGTAMVYPTLLAAVGDVAHPSWRASAVGVYRWWRDLGYAVGAIVAGALADASGMNNAIAVVGLLTIASGILVKARMPETRAGIGVM
jgi:MFS family permease